jgi:hypothetical protein
VKCKKPHGNYSKISLPIILGIIKQKTMGCNMSFKVHFLDSHLDFFQENPRAVSDEYRERFHQDISTMEKPCQAKWSPSFVADYCWTFRSDIPQAKFSRKAPTVTL